MSRAFRSSSSDYAPTEGRPAIIRVALLCSSNSVQPSALGEGISRCNHFPKWDYSCSDVVFVAPLHNHDFLSAEHHHTGGLPAGESFTAWDRCSHPLREVQNGTIDGRSTHSRSTWWGSSTRLPTRHHVSPKWHSTCLEATGSSISIAPCE